MPKYAELDKRKDEETITVAHHVWFLKFLNKFRMGRESWEHIVMRLITSKKLLPEDSQKLKKEIANYEKFL